MNILITGGAGFIGSAVIRHLIKKTDSMVINVDKLTYAGNLESLASVVNHPHYHFERVDICNAREVTRLFEQYQPNAIMHLAAESHVDRSIDGPGPFIETNIVGTYTLLEAARTYWDSLKGRAKIDFRFHHVSTDEVFGSLGKTGAFTEESAYHPNSPYSASKASSDHLVQAWHHTYGLPIVMTNCSNNYGPYQFPEKLIPLMILNGLEGKALPVYGSGDNTRDWLFVEDHAEALHLVLSSGKIGETYNIGGNEEKTNLQVVEAICNLLDNLAPNPKISKHTSLITFVPDRPGHDQRYAINAEKIQSALNWKPKENFEAGLRKTIKWYLENPTWCQRILDGDYQRERLGLMEKN